MKHFRFLLLASLLVFGTAAASVPQSVRSAPKPDYRHGFSQDVLRLKLKDEVGAEAVNGAVIDAGKQPLNELRAILNDFTTAEPLIKGVDKATLHRLRQEGRASGQETLPDLSQYFRIKLHGKNRDETIAKLQALPFVEDAYPEPLPAPAPTTPDLSANQKYLLPATSTPSGINAEYAHAKPGGKGDRVRLADIEYSWNAQHEDLSDARQSDTLIKVGTPVDPFDNKNHGTAAVGLSESDHNSIGLKGIAPDAKLHLVNANSFEYGWNIAEAIVAAATKLTAGDVLLIEQQLWGPTPEEYDFVPVEFDPAIYDAIKTATANGIIVVEPAGNGSQNLDDTAYYGSRFPQGKADSGAIIVGAGIACEGSSPIRSRRWNSTYGSRVNLQGWGECVATTGYGDLYGTTANASYSLHNFNSTSSASAMVAAAAASLSSAYEAKFNKPATPKYIRNKLVNTGTPQDTTSTGALPGKIGPLPNLEKAIKGLTLAK